MSNKNRFTQSSGSIIWDREDHAVIALAKNSSCLSCRSECESSASQPARAESVKIHATNRYMLSQFCGTSS